MEQPKRAFTGLPVQPGPNDTAWPGRRAAPAQGREIATESLLAAPLPRPPAAPRLELGRDYLPFPGGPEFGPTTRRSTLRWIRERKRPLQGALAVLLGFGVGLAIAWLVGLI